MQAEAKRRKQEEFDKLPDEEKAKRLEEEAATVKHEARKEKMLTNHMKAYGKSNAASILAGGKGRGRGGKHK